MTSFNLKISLIVQIIISGILVLSCDSSSPSSTDGDNNNDFDAGLFPDELRGPCPLDQKVGSFEVSILDTYSSIGGYVSEGMVPSNVPKENMVLDECRLLQKMNPECSPACESGQTCDLNGECIPYPQNQNAGAITVKGLQEKVTMNPLDALNYFISVNTHPIFKEGDRIYLTSTDGYAGKLKLYGMGVGALEVLDDHWMLSRGEPLTINWSPPGVIGKSRILLNMNIDQHGASPYRVYCDLEDTGSYIIPAQLIDALIDAGVTGFPNGRLTRRTVDSMQIGASCVEFIVSAPVKAAIKVAGVTPCNSDKDCPGDQTCNMVTHLCESG